MFSLRDKREALDRELSYRRRVFPRLVANGKMYQHTADQQIAIFEAIREDYAKQEQSERLI
jgi:hypothetical protein